MHYLLVQRESRQVNEQLRCSVASRSQLSNIAYLMELVTVQSQAKSAEANGSALLGAQISILFTSNMYASLCSTFD